MTKYAKLIKQRDNFILAAMKAEDEKMINLWTERAKEVQKKLLSMNMSEVF